MASGRLPLDKYGAIDSLIRAAQEVTYAQESADLNTLMVKMDALEGERQRMLQSIYGFCDCGKGDLCPQYGARFSLDGR